MLPPFLLYTHADILLNTIGILVDTQLHGAHSSYIYYTDLAYIDV